MTELIKDVVYSLRMLRKNPWVSGAAVLALALGIGANIAIFSVTNTLLLRPLAYPEPDRLVQIQRQTRKELSPTFSEEKYLFWRQGGRVFQGMAAYDGLPHGYILKGDGHPEIVDGARVSGEFFQVFGVRPAVGRWISPEDDRPGAAGTAVLSHGLWQQRFGGDPGVVGQQVSLDGESFTVVGVMPEDFRYPAGIRLWTSLRADPAHPADAEVLLITARLADGVSRDAALTEMEQINRRYLEFKGWGESDDRASVLPLQVFLNGDYRQALLVLLAAVGLVLLIACANVTNLQLARFAGRRREVAIRTALGASSSRMARLILTESLVLAGLGGLGGLALCGLALRPLVALAPAAVSASQEVVVDGSVLAFAVGIALLTGLLAGIAPILQARRVPVNETVKEGSTGSGVGGGRLGSRVRYGLVVLEVALALILMVGAGLLVKSFAGLRSVDPGFDAGNVLTLKIPLPPARYGAAGGMEKLQRELLPEIQAVPGVRSAALSTNLPLELGADMTFVIDGRWSPGSKEGTGIGQYRAVTPAYFDALEVAVKRGRKIAPSDTAGAPGVVLLNETAAKRYFPGENPLGRRLVIGLPDMVEQADPAPREIVGIVEDVRETSLESDPPAILYVPLEQMPPSLGALIIQLLPMNVVVRTEQDPGLLTRSVEERVWAFDPDLPVANVQPMEERVARSIGSRRFHAVLLGSLAVLALVLASLGVYGVLAYLVTQRTREIGIRIALGGDRGQIHRLVLRQGMVPVLLGIALGLAGALASSRLLAGFLYGVSATDPSAMAGVAMVMAAVALLATYLPARRASRLDPMEALRNE